MTALGDAFVHDHRQTTRRLSRLLKALRRNDPAEARRLADELDRIAGPHIRFEEEIFYPEVARILGREYAARLYDEHQIGRGALADILSRDTAGPLEPEEQKDLVGRVETAVSHAASCGTLLSHLTGMEESQQAEMLSRLEELRREGKRWTELPPRIR